MTKSKRNDLLSGFTASVEAAYQEVEQRISDADRIPTASSTAREYSITYLSEHLDDNPWQPRIVVDEDADNALQASILQHGLLHPPIARLSGEQRLQIAAGHRRYRAVLALHEKGMWPSAAMPLDVRDFTDEQMAVIALAENVDRRNLNLVEEIRAWQRILTEIPGMTQKKLAAAIKRDQSTISNGIRILALPESAIASMERGNLPLRAARELLCVVDQTSIIDDVIEECEGDHDFRTDHVLRNLHVALSRTGWVQMTNAYRDVEFDLDAFKKKHPGCVYQVPRVSYDGTTESSALWCSDRHLFSSWQGAALKAKRAAEGEPEEPALPTHDPAQLADKFLARLAKKHKVELVDAEGNIAEAVKEEAGTRAQPTTQYGGGLYYQNDYHLLSKGFLDTSDCGTCTNGAVYVKHRYLSTAELMCANSKCFKRHIQQGKQRYERHFRNIAVEHDAAVVTNAHMLAERLADTPGFAALYRTFLRRIQLDTDSIHVTLWDRIPRGNHTYEWDFDYHMQMRTRRISAGIMRIAELTNAFEGMTEDQILAKYDRYSISKPLQEAIAAIPDDDPRLPEIAALALSEWAHHNEGWGKPPDLSKPDKAAAEAQETAQDEERELGNSEYGEA